MKTLNARPLVATVAGADWARVARWDGAQFKARGASLITATHRVAAIARGRLTRSIAAKALSHLNKVLMLVIDRVGGVKAGVDLQGLWDDAIRDVLSSVKGDLRRALESDVRSGVGQGWSRTNMLLGRPIVPLPGADDLAHGVLDKSDSIDTTTGERISNAARRGIEEGLSGRELATEVRLQVMSQAPGRSMLIGRTVAQDAWSTGSVESMQRDLNITHISVIGCMSREYSQWDKPSYRDYMWPPEGEDGDGRSPESACNIEDVPVEFAHQLNWHPNHTGTVVPSRWL